jgi:hypothetical protein
MNLKYIVAGLALLPIIGFGVPARASSVNLVTNGNFSSVTQGTTSLIENNAYGAAVTGWTTTSGYSFLLTSTQANAGFYNGYTTSGSLYTGSGTPYSISFYTVAGSPVGGNFVAQDANYLTGTLSQTISGLTVGDVYAVSFYQALAQQSGFSGSTTAQWGVSLGSQSVTSPLMTDGLYDGHRDDRESRFYRNWDRSAADGAVRWRFSGRCAGTGNLDGDDYGSGRNRVRTSPSALPLLTRTASMAVEVRIR